jgi:Ran GTPase-activating protein (RanGAP) involved in mRNA processing and transport
MSIIVQRAILDKKCKGLYLTGNLISNHSITILSDALFNNLTLVELDLSDNRISDHGVRILMDVLLTNKSILKKLHLGSNNISDQGMEWLANMLKTNHSLTHLMLNRNHITNHGVHLLSNVLALHNISLEVLSLSSNNLITDSSVDSLVIMLKHNEILKELDIKFCNISEINNQRLRQTIDEKNGFKLYTNSNENHCILL